MSYRIEWTRSAVREVRTLPTRLGLRVAQAVGELADTPRPKGCKKLVGSKDLWRIRIGQYRVVYSIGDPVKLIRVERVSHRKDVYR